MNPLKLFLPRGRQPRTVLSGLFAGLRLQLDLRQGDGQIWAGLYEQEIFADVRRLMNGCRSVVDLGAAKGDLTIWSLLQPGIEHVVAVEPQATERVQLQSNLLLNRLSTDARLRLHAGFAGQGAPPEWQTLDELASGLPAPLFIKIDIDGPEAQVLDTGRNTLAKQDCRLLIETHSPEAESGCIERLTALGYQTRIIFPAWWRIVIPEHRPIPHNRWLSAWLPAVA